MIQYQYYSRFLYFVFLKIALRWSFSLKPFVLFIESPSKWIEYNRDFNGYPIYVFLALGYYVFIEASAPRKANDTARMISPDVQKSGQCLTFWYHMYGQHIHILNIYLKSKGVLGSPVWTMRGTHGDQWRKGEVSLIGATPFQVSHDW